jgi:very-short-patch-repair endonuclease
MPGDLTPQPSDPSPPSHPTEPRELRFCSTPWHERTTREIEQRVAALAAEQWGVVAARQLVASGVGRSTIARLVKSGRLIRRHRGVYAVGHASLRPEGHRMAAVLACGPGAVLSDRTAAGVWGVRPDNRPRYDVTVPGAGGRKLPGIVVHQRRLDPRDVTTVNGIPVTTLARTYLDLAACVPTDHTAKALERGEQLRLFDLRAVDDVLARHPGHRGAARLRTAVDRMRPDHERLRSWLEREALVLIERLRLPRPALNAELHGHEVDLLWPEHRLVVELDSRTYHDTALAFETDRRRDADHVLGGYRVLRITRRRLDEDRAGVADALRTLLRPRGARRTPGPA